MTLTSWQFHAPPRIVFGPGTVKTVGDEAKALGAKKVLVVTDKGVAGAGILAKVLASLEAAGIECVVFDKVEPNPRLATVEEGHRLFMASGCNMAVSVGGGSSMDSAKAICILATNPGPILQYEGANKYPNHPLPTLAVPTTAGTGAEVTQTCVVTDTSRNYKVSIRGGTNVSRVAVLDPQLLTSLPPKVVASTGMDALSHAVESYLSTTSSPLTEALALEAIGVISHRLRDFVRQPSDESAAADMVYAAMTAGLAFANSRVTAVHAIAHALGGHFDVPHGVGCAMLLAPVMEFCLPTSAAKLTRVAVAMGEDVAGLPEEEAGKRAVAAVRALGRDIGIPERLRDLGVTADKLDVLAHDADISGIHLTTPRKVTLDDERKLIEGVF
ncbi:MAG: iron-containing alcohol dehydrogenase [Chloroflexota bacterium]